MQVRARCFKSVSVRLRLKKYIANDVDFFKIFKTKKHLLKRLCVFVDDFLCLGIIIKNI